MFGKAAAGDAHVHALKRIYTKKCGGEKAHLLLGDNHIGTLLWKDPYLSRTIWEKILSAQKGVPKLDIKNTLELKCIACKCPQRVVFNSTTSYWIFFAYIPKNIKYSNQITFE